MRSINSGCIGINITRNQDTAFGVSLQFITAQETAVPCPLYIIPAQPELTLQPADSV